MRRFPSCGGSPHGAKPSQGANKLVQPRQNRGRAGPAHRLQSQTWAAHHLQSEATREAAPKAISENREAAPKDWRQARHHDKQAAQSDLTENRMANYGRLGPAGALRYCRSVSIDFEEEPSTQETEQREQALLQKLGFYDDRIEAKMRSDTEFHRIVGAQTKTNGTERKMTRESFLMAARQLWGLDHVQAAAAFASADLTGEDTLNKREYLLLREAFHHRDARPCGARSHARGRVMAQIR